MKPLVCTQHGLNAAALTATLRLCLVFLMKLIFNGMESLVILCGIIYAFIFPQELKVMQVSLTGRGNSTEGPGIFPVPHDVKTGKRSRAV